MARVGCLLRRLRGKTSVGWQCRRSRSVAFTCSRILTVTACSTSERCLRTRWAFRWAYCVGRGMCSWRHHRMSGGFVTPMVTAWQMCARCWLRAGSPAVQQACMGRSSGRRAGCTSPTDDTGSTSTQRKGDTTRGLPRESGACAPTAQGWNRWRAAAWITRSRSPSMPPGRCSAR